MCFFILLHHTAIRFQEHVGSLERKRVRLETIEHAGVLDANPEELQHLALQTATTQWGESIINWWISINNNALLLLLPI